MPKIDKDAKGEAARIRARATVKAVLKHQGNQTEAAKELGISKNTLRDRIVKNPYCREELRKALKRNDVTVDKYSRVIADAMEAEREVVSEDGEIVATRPDHGIRLKAADSFLKAVGLAAEDKSAEMNLGGNHIHLHLGDKSDNDLVEDIRSQLAFFRNGQSASPS